MNIIDIQTEMLSGKKIRIWFSDGSSCMAESIEDITCTEKYAERYEIVNSKREKDEAIRVAIIDADLIGRDRHRFPNLASEKISAYWKEQYELKS